MWGDLVAGKPRLENTLGVDAREMKADMYLKMFKQSTDLDHPCRIPGSAFLRCLKANFASQEGDRDSKCGQAFNVFDACRNGIKQQQAEATDTAIAKQDIADQRAKGLFQRRTILLDTLSK
uniref:COX assembly mitochondrial protein n=1 Tax=Oxyrrhis marina TaxID=2969 RepID=A0A7S3URS1_OXYMA